MTPVFLLLLLFLFLFVFVWLCVSKNTWSEGAWMSGSQYKLPTTLGLLLLVVPTIRLDHCCWLSDFTLLGSPNPGHLDAAHLGIEKATWAGQRSVYFAETGAAQRGFSQLCNSTFVIAVLRTETRRQRERQIQRDRQTDRQTDRGETLACYSQTSVSLQLLAARGKRTVARRPGPGSLDALISDHQR